MKSKKNILVVLLLISLMLFMGCSSQGSLNFEKNSSVNHSDLNDNSHGYSEIDLNKTNEPGTTTSNDVNDEEITSGIVDENDSVEIGELI